MKSKDNGYDTKVSAPAGKSTIGKAVRQPVGGKLGGGMHAMPGSSGPSKGGAVKAASSQPTTGKLGGGMTAMGNGSIINGKV